MLQSHCNTWKMITTDANDAQVTAEKNYNRTTEERDRERSKIL